MADKQKSKKINRTMTVTVRLDPLLKTAADLAARKHRRTLSGYIEWALAQALEKEVMKKEPLSWGDKEEIISGIEAGARTWNPDEIQMFINQMYMFRELATHEEMYLTELICRNGFLWKGEYRENGDWIWDTSVQSNLLLDRLREHWETFKAVAKGKLPVSALPEWHKNAHDPIKDDQEPVLGEISMLPDPMLRNGKKR